MFCPACLSTFNFFSTASGYTVWETISLNSSSPTPAQEKRAAGISVVLKRQLLVSGLPKLTSTESVCFSLLQSRELAKYRKWIIIWLDGVSPTVLLGYMAVARKIKTLLTVNIFVFVGIILFSVYCRIQDRSEELIQIGRISDQRLRARNGKVSNLVDRQSILQRLERLEDVVYNQLNGMHYYNFNNIFSI